MLRNPLPCPAATARSLLLPSLLVGLGALVAVPVAAQNWFVGRTPVTFGAPPGTVVLDLTLSADELVAFFVADRPGGAGGLYPARPLRGCRSSSSWSWTLVEFLSH